MAKDTVIRSPRINTLIVITSFLQSNLRAPILKAGARTRNPQLGNPRFYIDANPSFTRLSRPPRAAVQQTNSPFLAAVTQVSRSMTAPASGSFKIATVLGELKCSDVAVAGAA